MKITSELPQHILAVSEESADQEEFLFYDYMVLIIQKQFYRTCLCADIKVYAWGRLRPEIAFVQFNLGFGIRRVYDNFTKSR